MALPGALDPAFDLLATTLNDPEAPEPLTWKTTQMKTNVVNEGIKNDNLTLIQINVDF